MAGTGVGKFSSTAGSNTSNLTVNFAENMAPSNVNNAARELMGHIRDMYEQLGDGYFEFGDGDGEYTVARSDADTITITSSSDISSVYFAGRKIRITDGGANVVEGTIASSSHTSTTQTVNLTGISLASGTPTKVELGVDTAAFGGRIILDDDGDTYIEAPTDDTIDIYLAGAKDFTFTANTFTAHSGSNVDLDGDLDVDGTTNLDVVDIDGAVDMASTLAVGDNITVTSSTSSKPVLKLDNTNTNANPSSLVFDKSVTGANDDILGRIDFTGQDTGNGEHTFARIDGLIQKANATAESGKLIFQVAVDDTMSEFMRIQGGSGAGGVSEVMFNEGSGDHDFRVESNGNTHMLFVDGGNNRVGVFSEPDLGSGLHIRTADSSASVNGDGDELVIEHSGNAGLSILTGTSNVGGIFFGDSGDNDIGGILYNHANNDLTITAEAAEAMRFDGKVISTGGETAADVSGGGICLNQGVADSNILSFKSSDVAHGMTSNAETDTYAEFVKQDASIGGLAIHTYSEQKLCMDLQGHAGLAEESSPGTSSFAPVRVNVKLKSGTGGTALGNGAHLFCVSNDDSTKFMIDGDGTFHSDGSGATYDIYEDAQLVRAFDLSHGKGVIDSKFDKFISYNHEKLAELKLVGREKDGTPNYFINYPAFNRLHNGAIWQQYEKHQRLAEAVYEMAKEALGEDKADAILEKHDIKLLN